jgi:hypothetical protein
VFDGCSCRKSCLAFQRSTWSRSISSTSIRMARPAAATSSRPSCVRPSPQRPSVSSFSSSSTEWRDVSVGFSYSSRLNAPRYEIRRCLGSPRSRVDSLGREYFRVEHRVSGSRSSIKGSVPVPYRSPWQCFHLRPEPQVQGSLGPRSASSAAYSRTISDGARPCASSWPMIRMGRSTWWKKSLKPAHR